MTAVYTLGQLDELKAEFLLTLDNDEAVDYYVALERFLAWLVERERGPEPTLDEALAALRAMADAPVGWSRGNPVFANAQAILARVRK